MNHVILLVSAPRIFYSFEEFWTPLTHHLFKYRKFFESAGFNGMFLECRRYVFPTYVFNHWSTLQLLMKQPKDINTLYTGEKF